MAAVQHVQHAGDPSLRQMPRVLGDIATERGHPTPQTLREVSLELEDGLLRGKMPHGESFEVERAAPDSASVDP